MAIETDKLTALSVKHLARENAPARKHFDGAGLYLDVKPKGARYWRMKYRFAGQEKLLALGTYPDISLAEARGRRDSARAQLRDGIDPSAAKAARKSDNLRNLEACFPKVAASWLELKRQGWVEETYQRG